MIQIIGQHAVWGALAVGIGLLVADEHIKGFFLLADLKDAPLDSVNGLGFFLVHALLRTIGIRNGRFVVFIRKDGRELGAIHRRNTLLCRRILYVLDAVAAQHKGPVCLRIGPVILQDLLEDAHGLVVLVVAPEMVGTVIHVQPALVVQLRQCVHTTTVFALTGRCILCGAKVTAAHFAFDDHNSLFLSLSLHQDIFCNATDRRLAPSQYFYITNRLMQSP